MGEIIQVGMAEYGITVFPNKLLTAGLGSCIGICICDRTKQLGSLAHIMLPSSVQAKKNQNRAKFADSAIELVLDEMIKRGARKPNMFAKIAGGAQMFKLSGKTNVMNIGERNAIAVIEHLKLHNIKLLAKDVGGNFGRTITFDPATGGLHIRTIGHGERVI